MLTYFVNNPGLFWAVTIITSVVYGVRGIFWQCYYENIPDNMSRPAKVFLHYGHDFVYNFFCSLAGFVALRLAANIMRSISDQNKIADIGVGTSGLLAFLILVAILGISGVLPRFFWKGALIGKRD